MRDDPTGMRTTLDLDDDVLQAAKEIAASKGTTAGRVVSDLLRRALTPSTSGRVRNGVPLLPRRPPGAPGPTMKQVNALRDETYARLAP
jgi:hypothetical protein